MLQNWMGRTPLHYAYKLRDEKETVARESIAQLLEAGADVNARDCGGDTPLSMNIYCYKNARIARLLIEGGADVNSICHRERLIHWAARRGDAETVRLLLNAGAEPNSSDTDGRNALHHAVRATDFHDIMLRLFEAGVNANATDNKGMTPMHELLMWSNHFGAANAVTFAKARLLIDNGANIDALNKCGHTPLFMAFARHLDAYYRMRVSHVYWRTIREGRQELCSWFVANGARLDIVAPVKRDKWDDLLGKCIGLFSFAHLAIFHDDAELLKAAIAHGVDLNVRSKSHGSALHIACNRNNGTLAKILYENGAHVDIVSASVWQRFFVSFTFTVEMVFMLAARCNPLLTPMAAMCETS